MYKEISIFKLSDNDGNVQSWMKEFKTEQEFCYWKLLQERAGFTLISEECMVEPYPQILRLNLKYSLGGYSSVIERFKSKEDYLKYCDWKLSQGYKVIGSEPYLKEIENATY
jgi:hypothetical protein